MRRWIDWRKLLRSLGSVMAALSGYFVVTYAMEAASGGDGATEPGIYAGLIVFFSGTLASGAYLSWRMGRPPPDTLPRRRITPPPVELPEEMRERRILQLVEHERGRVTVLEVAARLRLTVDEAKAALDRMVLQQRAEMHVSEDGILVYVFPAFLPPPRQHRRQR